MKKKLFYKTFYRNKAELVAVEKLLDPLMFPKDGNYKDTLTVGRVPLLRILRRLARRTETKLPRSR